MEDMAEMQRRVQRVPHAFARNIRARRWSLGYSQERVAFDLNVYYGIKWHQTVVGKVESEVRDVKLHEAYALCTIYGIALDDLIAGRGVDMVEALDREEGGTREVPIEEVRKHPLRFIPVTGVGIDRGSDDE